MNRVYAKEKQMIERYIKKHGNVDHRRILNEVDIDYDTLMRILTELKQEGKVR